ncbi:MAG TPA: NTP transferase domain-containing protein, partial [Halanaerobiales bacterium]|nr:NTP transferase domain-containing protein [Halanaerobiales bacterium]
MANIAAIVQARMGSARLPGKVAEEIEDKTMLAHLVERLKYVQKIDQIIIATSNKEIDNQVTHIARANGVVYYRGSETDVLSRYIEAGKRYKVDIVMRITGDCPLIDPVTLDELIQGY